LLFDEMLPSTDRPGYVGIEIASVVVHSFIGLDNLALVVPVCDMVVKFQGTQYSLLL
jgi:hypothetical protein